MSTDRAALVAKKWMDLAPQMMRRIRVHVIESSVGSLTMPQYRIMANINRGLNSVGEIALHHGVTQPSMSKMINLMVERGLVERNIHPSDKRQSMLFLTGKGRTLFLKVKTKAEKKIAGQLKQLEQNDLILLEKSFLAIEQVLER